MKCPVCKEEIEEGAKKCKHCGNYVRVRRRFWGHVISGLQFCTLIAALVILYFTWQDSRSIREQFDIQKESLRQLSEQFIEEMRPRIEIAPTRVEPTDGGVVLYVTFKNTGFADAQDIQLYVILKYEDTPKDTLAYRMTPIVTITKDMTLTQPYRASLPRKADLTCFIQARYTWEMKSLRYHNQKYLRFPYDKVSNSYRRLVLDKEEIEKLWR